jgi:hypothetical protein
VSIRVKERVEEINYGSKQVQGSEGDGALRHPSGPSARPENDRKTTGFTKPLEPELNFGKEKVKVWGGQPVENLKSRSSLVRFGPVWSSPNGRTADEKALTGKNR